VHPLLAVTLLLVAGIGVLRLTHARTLRPLPRSLRALVIGGIPLVLVGLLLGPGLHLFDANVTHALAPLLVLGAGWVGAAFGTRLEWRMMRRIPWRGWVRGAVLGLPVFILTALLVWALLRFIPPLGAVWGASGRRAAVLTLAAAATVSTGISRVKAARRAGLFDTILAALAAAVAVALAQPSPIRGAIVALLASGAGAALWLWLRPRSGFVLAGVVLLTAGVAYAAGMSPFVVCALLTALIVSFGPPELKRVIGGQLATWEPGIYAAFLIVAGAWLRLPTSWVLALGIALAVLRSVVRWGTVRFGRRWHVVTVTPPPGVFVPMAQGAGAVAIAAGFALVRADGAVLAAVIVSVLLAEVITALLDRSQAERLATAGAPLTASPREAEVT
jgi:hypothetical protein